MLHVHDVACVPLKNLFGKRVCCMCMDGSVRVAALLGNLFVVRGCVVRAWSRSLYKLAFDQGAIVAEMPSLYKLAFAHGHTGTRAHRHTGTLACHAFMIIVAEMP